jgi:hypothetical protein
MTTDRCGRRHSEKQTEGEFEKGRERDSLCVREEWGRWKAGQLRRYEGALQGQRRERERERGREGEIEKEGERRERERDGHRYRARRTETQIARRRHG